MPKLLPPRPRYARERASFSYLMLAVFGLCFAARLCAKLLRIELRTPGNVALLAALALLLPAICFLRYRGRGYVRTLRCRRPFAAHVPLLIFAFFALFSGTVLLSALFGGLPSLGNISALYATPYSDKLWLTLLLSPAIALFPAVTEEFLFRGVLCAELDRRGLLRTVLLGSLLFSLLHFSAANLLAHFYAGVILTLVLYATDSLIATMILHGALSLLLLVGGRYLAAFYAYTGGVELFVFLLLVTLLLSLFFFCRQAARLYRARAQRGMRPPRRDIPKNVQLYTLIDAICEWPVVLCLVLGIIGCILF